MKLRSPISDPTPPSHWSHPSRLSSLYPTPANPPRPAVLAHPVHTADSPATTLPLPADVTEQRHHSLPAPCPSTHPTLSPTRVISPLLFPLARLQGTILRLASDAPSPSKSLSPLALTNPIFFNRKRQLHKWETERFCHTKTLMSTPLLMSFASAHHCLFRINTNCPVPPIIPVFAQIENGAPRPRTYLQRTKTESIRFIR